MVIQRILSEIRDIEFVTAINGDQAVREIHKNMSEFQEYNSNHHNRNPKTRVSQKVTQPVHFDAIIMDLNMPIMDGYDACK